MKLGLLRDLVYMEEERLNKGGQGSGNFGHEGRPGEIGGSGEGGGTSGPSKNISNKSLGTNSHPVQSVFVG